MVTTFLRETFKNEMSLMNSIIYVFEMFSILGKFYLILGCSMSLPFVSASFAKELVLDDGAAKALSEHKSLLPVGIVAVRGTTDTKHISTITEPSFHARLLFTFLLMYLFRFL